MCDITKYRDISSDPFDFLITKADRFTFKVKGCPMKNSLSFYSHVRVAGMGLALTLILTTALTTGLNAQGATSATVLGTVTDSAGAVVPNATVQVKNVATGQVQQVATDAQGRYTVADLPVGDYEAQASAQGFQTTVRPGITPDGGRCKPLWIFR